MATTPTSTAGLITFTATATLGSVFSSSLPVVAPSGQPAITNILNSHEDPTVFNPNAPIVLFIIQLAVIIGFSRFLSLFLGKIRQPRVIAEVIGGILLGPTAFGRIPGFTEHIFPPRSLSYLSLIAELGLILFLFLVGMEVDFALFRRNFKVAVSVATAGLALPFGLGCAVSIGLYNEFIPSTVKQGNFLLFIGTSMSITAFPVLARILSELNLLSDRVGIITLSAGVANDVIGWVLLALTVALVNAGSGLVVLYVILCTVGWILALVFILRPLFSYMANKSGSFDGNGPTQSIVCAAMMLCLASAWVTEIVGVNAIFGGFCAGLVIPRRNGFATHLAEKFEDIIIALFIPVYFTLSGLKTDLTLLNTGIIWGWTACVILTAFFGKFVGCAITSKWCGFSTRESLAVGSLMSAKGLVELIVLNVGLSVGVVTQTVFSIFVLEAVLLTFLSTPLTLAFYPDRFRTTIEIAAFKRPSTIIEGDIKSSETLVTSGCQIPSLAVVLDQIENLGALMAVTKLFTPSSRSTPSPASPTEISPSIDAVIYPSLPDASSKDLATTSSKPTIDAVRLIELTDRTSAVFQASEWEETLRARDPLALLYNTFCSLEGLGVREMSLAVVAKAEYARTVAKAAREWQSQLVVMPWMLARSPDDAAGSISLPNPLESFFTRADPSPTYASFVRDVFAAATSDVALFLDRGASKSATEGRHHLFLTFHGGADDRSALDLLVRLVVANVGIQATVVRLVREPELTSDDVMLGLGSAVTKTPSTANDEMTGLTIGGRGGAGTYPAAADTVYPGQDDELASTTADEVAFADLPSTPRLLVKKVHTSLPLAASIALIKSTATSGSRLVVVTGRGRTGASSHRVELAGILGGLSDEALGVTRSGEFRRCLGEVGTAIVAAGVGESVMIVQSGLVKGERRAHI